MSFGTHIPGYEYGHCIPHRNILIVDNYYNSFKERAHWMDGKERSIII